MAMASNFAPPARREAAGQRFAVAARGGQGVRGRRIAAAVRIDEGDLLRRLAFRRGEEFVAVAIAERAGVDVVAFRGAHPAFFRQHDGDRFAGHQRGFIERLRDFAFDDRRAAFVAVFFGVGVQFVLDQRFQLRG